MATEDATPLWAWREEDEKLLEMWRRNLVGYRFMHKRAAREAKRYHTALKLPAMVLSAAAGTTLLASGGDTEKALAAAASLTVAVLTTADEFLGFQEVAARHFAAAKQAAKLLGTITAELSLPRARRSKPRPFLEQNAKAYDAVLQRSTVLPSSAVRAFGAHVRKHGVVGETGAIIQMADHADEVADLGEIHIV